MPQARSRIGDPARRASSTCPDRFVDGRHEVAIYKVRGLHILPQESLDIFIDFIHQWVSIGQFSYEKEILLYGFPQSRQVGAVPVATLQPWDNVLGV